MLRSSRNHTVFSIGHIAERTGTAVSAIRFYEEQGLIHSTRSSAGHRRFDPSAIRRVSFIRVCQQLGYSLQEIADALQTLPDHSAPTPDDWERLATGFRADLDERIRGLTVLRDKLDGCIGCGCLSLDKCEIYNANDRASSLGQGPRWLLGDEPNPQ